MEENNMRTIKVEKITLNIGSGKNPGKLDKGIKLLKSLTGVEPVKTFAHKRIPAWGLRPGLPIGCKLTLRKNAAYELLPRLLKAKDNKLSITQFDNNGNLAFGIHEYVDIPGIKYDPDIGIMGFEVCVTLERNGYRIKRRRIRPSKIPKDHTITRENAIEFMKTKFNASVGEDEQ
ncbi:MAG TPA: 50S ribosomal protein L5 [Candidatus Nanoarchaeia archaeon]|nr:50S ribosomal protein L5 [Candidatus Nanoarchaeia archaeon]